MTVSGYEKRAAELGKKLKEYIRSAGYSQQDFADSLGIAPSRLSNYITGARMPDIFTLADITERLGLTLDQLFTPDQSLPKRYVLTVYKSGEISLVKDA